MRTKFYNFLVNKHPGIAYRYHKIHDESTGMLKIVSWAYLLSLNMLFYLFFQKSIGLIPEMKPFEDRTF